MCMVSHATRFGKAGDGWEMWRRCVRDVKEMSGRCEGDEWEMWRRLVRDVKEMSERCKERYEGDDEWEMWRRWVRGVREILHISRSSLTHLLHISHSSPSHDLSLISFTSLTHLLHISHSSPSHISLISFTSLTHSSLSHLSPISLTSLTHLLHISPLHTKYSVSSSAIIAIWLHWKLHNANRTPINQLVSSMIIKQHTSNRIYVPHCMHQFGYTYMHDTQSTEHHESQWFIRFASVYTPWVHSRIHAASFAVSPHFWRQRTHLYRHYPWRIV